MQDEIDATYPELDIQILGCNRAGEESENDLMTEGRDLPWLQDVDGDNDGESDAWTNWDVTLRDVIITNTANVKVGTFNLTTHSLVFPENYDVLLQMLVDASAIRGDVNLDSSVNLLDVVPFVNRLTSGDYQIEADIDGDGEITPLDVGPFVELLTCN